jgi:Mg2+ and Co2+ transporter CorA
LSAAPESETVVWRPAPEIWPGLIWGFDIVDGHPGPIAGDRPAPGAFRWLHVNLSDQRAQRWIAGLEMLPPLARDVLLSVDEHPRALIDDSGTIACVIHDGGREFAGDEEDVVRAFHFALTAELMLTARLHPVRCADEIKRRLDIGPGPSGPAAALDLLVSTNVDEVTGRVLNLVGIARDMEDRLVEKGRAPDDRAIQQLRRRAIRIHRQAAGLHGVLGRLERDEALPTPLLPPVERLVQRVAGMESDVAALIQQERLLREELTAREAQRTNQNLYILSVMTALMLPPTLIAGLFGMNTSGLLFATGSHGTLIACMLALGSAVATYVLLRAVGFFRTD